MKPRQTMKNYHNSNAPPYQHLQNSTTPPTLRDIDPIKLGLDELSNLQATNPSIYSNQQELLKYIRDFCSGNRDVSSLPLPDLGNEWPTQSASPPDYSRASSVIGASSNNNNNNNNNNINNNNINSVITNPGQQQKQQDIHFAGSQQHPHPPSAINNHFRVSTSNIHSPQQLQQQKSVLSLHHQHHQNDLSNRRLNHHHMSTSNASFANLSAVNVTSATPTSNPSSSLDTNILSTHRLSSETGGSVSLQVPNIIDTLGSMDNMFYDNMLMSKEAPNNQQSLMKHQHLQKLLKATGSQRKSSSSPSTLSHRNDLQSQRNIMSNNMQQNQLPISSSSATTISPPQPAFSSVPKSLLNLAACSSSSSSANNSSLNSASKFSSMYSQLNLMSARNATSSNQANLNSSSHNNSASNTRSRSSNSNINNNDDMLQQKGLANGSDQSNLLQHMIRTGVTASSSAGPPATRSSTKQVQLSLLSEDQSSANRTSSKATGITNPVTNTKPQSGTSKPPNVSSKDFYLAELQERAARVGVSIGEISKTTTTSSQISDTTSHNNASAQHSTVIISPNQAKNDYTSTVDRKEIESALSRVEARNDLSLLYPPMLLASNSQKQINALSAGLEGSEESELFTKEVKKIVLEECNIIYECKECNNLFRSLANLVKHKRTYCLENSTGRNSIEMNKRSFVNPSLPTNQPAITINSSGATAAGETRQDLEIDPERNSIMDTRPNESILLSNFNNNNNNYVKNPDRRTNLSNMIRLIQNEDKKNQQRDIARLKGQTNGSTSGANSAPQTSLSKLLQSQPKTRLPVSRDSALMGALNMTPIENPLSAYESDKNINDPTTDMNEQFVRNSSLAKTLLNEKVKATNVKPSSSDSSKVESTERGIKRVAPKRKFLEDCIQKVKRDKLLNDDEEEDDQAQMIPTTSQLAITTIIEPTSLQQANKESQITTLEVGSVGDGLDYNSPGDSEIDSDVLTIDLDEPARTKPKKSLSNLKALSDMELCKHYPPIEKFKEENRSSALLKALTRPVGGTKRQSDASPIAVEESTDKEPKKKKSPSQKESIEANSSLSAKPKKQNESLLSNQKVSKIEESGPGKKEEKSQVDDNASELSRPLFSSYTCDWCNLETEDPEELLKHSISKHSQMMIIFPCPFCSFSFISIENVCRHIMEIHKKTRSEIQRLKDVVRSRCYESNDYSACRDCPPSESRDDEQLENKSPIYEPSSNHQGSSSTNSPNPQEAGPATVVATAAAPVAQSPQSQSSSSTESSSYKTGSLSSETLEPSTSPQQQVPPWSWGLPEEENPEEAAPTKTTSPSGDVSPSRQAIDSSAESDGDEDDNDDDDEDEEDDEDDDDDDDDEDDEEEEEDVQSPQDSSEQDKQQLSEHTKESNSQKTSPSSKSNQEPSTSSAGSGGIMKLKIQLKTRPDEKSKVYEIV